MADRRVAEEEETFKIKAEIQARFALLPRARLSPHVLHACASAAAA